MGPRRQGREHQGRLIRRDSITVPTLWVAIGLSLILHALLLLGWLPKVLSSPIDDPEKGKKSGTLAVRLAPPPKPPPPAIPQPILTRPATTRDAAQPKAAPVPPPTPKVLALERPAPSAIKPPPAEAPRPAPSGDFASYVAARRNAREPAPAPPPAPTVRVESEQDRINREAAERLGLTRTPTFGSEKERGGGVFQVQRMGMDDAEFFFYGWNKAIRRNARQMISVRREGNPTIEIAVVRRMVAIIREYAKDDFTWESQRLGRDVQLSSRLSDNAGLEDFMMQEFWERGTKAVMQDVIAAAKKKADKVYISIDIDVLDPGFAPATGTPEPGGFAPVDLLRIVRQLVLELDVVAFDVMEVAPPYDHADITVNNAHRLVWEALAAMSAKARDARR